MKDLPKYYQQIPEYLNGELNEADVKIFELALSEDLEFREEVVLERVLLEASLRKKAKEKVASLQGKVENKETNSKAQSISVKEDVAKKTAKIRTLRLSWIKIAGIAASIAILIFVIGPWTRNDTALSNMNLEEISGFTPNTNPFTKGQAAFLQKDYTAATSDFKSTLAVLRLPLDSLKVHYALAITYLRTETTDSLKMETKAIIDVGEKLKPAPYWKEAKLYIDWANKIQEKIINGENWKQHPELDL